MSDSKATTDPLEEKLSSLIEADFARIRQEFRKKLRPADAANLETCVHCGLCADSCHYALSDEDIRNIPAYKLNLISSVFKRYFTRSGRVAPRWAGARDLDPAMVREWVDTLYGRCSLCGRCAVNCSTGINIPALIRAARGALDTAGLTPPELLATIALALETGNNMGIARDEWVETVQWLEEELQQETGNPQARLPLDVRGARLLYTVNPREPKFFPLSLLAAAKIFHAANESWTLSSDCFDLTNYALYNGNDADAGRISERLARTMADLGANTLVIGECGHGFAANRWEGPEWLQQEYGFEVKSVLQVIAEYLEAGKIRLDPGRHPLPVTLHDPCNLVRLGGVIEEQRVILRQAVTELVEMTPNRTQNFCCGGGGGQLAMTRYARRRLESGRIKADQIRATGAKVVAAPCHNCIDQLSELNKEYKLGIAVKSVCELVADALVL